MVEIKLHHPFEYDGNQITSINLNRPKGKHIKKLPATPTTEDVLILAARCSGQPTTLFDEMDAEDCMQVAEVIGDFLDSGRKTGNS